MTRKQKAPSDSTLQTLWRKCVRNEWGNRCAFADEKCWGDLQCHHIVKRKRTHLKHVQMNGILLCTYHHSQAETLAGKKRVEEAKGPEKMALLSDMERQLFKVYLSNMRMTRTEYLVWVKEILRRTLLEDI